MLTALYTRIRAHCIMDATTVLREAICLFERAPARYISSACLARTHPHTWRRTAAAADIKAARGNFIVEDLREYLALYEQSLGPRVCFKITLEF